MQKYQSTDLCNLLPYAPNKRSILQLKKLTRIFKLTTLIVTFLCLQASAATYSQLVTISANKTPFKKVTDAIEQQTDVKFIWHDELLELSKPVTLELNKVPLEEALLTLFKGQVLSYVIKDQYVIVRTLQPLVVQPASWGDPGNVKGRVTNEKGEPLSGISVSVKGSRKMVVTNDKGEFEIDGVEGNATLVISGVSHEQQEVKWKSGEGVTVVLKDRVNELDETVVVAYGTTTQRANTGAVTVVKGEQIQNLPNRSFDRSLQGLVPGLLVTSGSGQPGGGLSNFVLRGIATGGQPISGETYRNPLIVVDGVPVTQDPLEVSGSSSGPSASNPIAQLNPSDIESISILKDAAAISLYGSKASNGVILVTTKKGKAGRTMFNFRHQTDVSERLKEIEVLNKDQYLELVYEAYRNSIPGIKDSQIKSDLISKFPYQVSLPGDTSFYPASDWSSKLYNNAAVTVVNEISMSGGNEKSNFYINLEWIKQDGVVKKTGFDRKSIRFNYENRPASFLKVGLNTTLSYNIQNYSSGAEAGGVLSLSPLNSIRDANGKFIYNYGWGFGSSGNGLRANPLAEVELNINRNTSYRGLSRIYGEMIFLKHFTFTSTIGVDFIANEAKQKVDPLLVISAETVSGIGKITDVMVRNANIISNNILRFNRAFNKSHSVNLLVGQEAQILTRKHNLIERRGLSSNPTSTQVLAGTTSLGGDDKQTLLSYFGQANYDFRNKYLLSGNIRSDGSSVFGDNKRFGTYWSVGGGWVVSEEPFMKRLNKKWVDQLKFRGSIGTAGSSAAILNTIQFDALTLVSYLNNVAVFPDRGKPGNPDIQWERTFTWDAGIEVSLFNERLRIIADVYNRKTSNLIASGVTLPGATGFFSITDNIGDLRNKGIELSLSVEIVRIRNFSWKVNANWSKNENTLTKSFFPERRVGNAVNKVGYAYNSFYLKRWAGVNSTNGAPMWMDSTGKPSEDYNASKPDITGKIQPDGFGAITNTFSYKGFELSAMLYYQYGFQILYVGNILQNDGGNPYVNQSKAAFDRWQKPGDIASNPRRLLNGLPPGSAIRDRGTESSTRYLYDGDFIRLSNVSLSYNFPKSIFSRMRLMSLELYIQGQNLMTWTKYSGQDPENMNVFGVGNFLYPQQRSFTIGLKVGF